MSVLRRKRSGERVRSAQRPCSAAILYDIERALAVTDAGDLADYILSLSGMTALRDIPRDRLVSVLEANMSGGVLTVPKEYGMFISRP